MFGRLPAPRMNQGIQFLLTRQERDPELIYSSLSSNLEAKNEEKHGMLYLIWNIPTEVILHLSN